MLNTEVFVAILLGVVGVVGLVILARYLRGITVTEQYAEITQTNPQIGDIMEALEKYVYQAIATGERAVVWGLDEIEAYLDGEDKAAVANFWYDLLPENLVVYGVPIPINRVKALVPRENFQAFVRDLYDGFNTKVNQFEDQFKAQVDAFVPDEEEDNNVNPVEPPTLEG